MEEILLTVNEKEWVDIRSGKKTMIVKRNKPQMIFYPFRVIVYIPDEQIVVGKFDCDFTLKTIRPEALAKECCMTEKEILQLSNGKALCWWHVKAGSVVEYERYFTLEEATGIKKYTGYWRYLNRDEQDE